MPQVDTHMMHFPKNSQNTSVEGDCIKRCHRGPAHLQWLHSSSQRDVVKKELPRINVSVLGEERELDLRQ